MGSFMAWLLGIPAGALILTYMAIFAAVLGAKRRMAMHDTRSHQSAEILNFSLRTREPMRPSVRRPKVMARHGG